MKMYQHSPYVGILRLLFTTTLMFLAGILAWWSWAQTGLGGLRYALVGAIIVVAIAPFILVWFRKNTDANGR
jgi:FtsH-binding integral membrane protein